MGEISCNETNIAVFGSRGNVKSSGNNTRFDLVAFMVMTSHCSIARGKAFDTILRCGIKGEKLLIHAGSYLPK